MASSLALDARVALAQLIRDLMGDLAARREDATIARAVVARIEADLEILVRLPELKT